MKTSCTTHHYACDCREEIFKENQDKLKLALEIIEKLTRSNDFYADPEKWMRKDLYGWSMDSPRSHGDEDIIMKYHHPKTDWIGTIDVGGKLARQTQREVEELKKGLR